MEDTISIYAVSLEVLSHHILLLGECQKQAIYHFHHRQSAIQWQTNQQVYWSTSVCVEKQQST